MGVNPIWGRGLPHKDFIQPVADITVIMRCQHNVYEVDAYNGGHPHQSEGVIVLTYRKDLNCLRFITKVVARN
jgi:hypothetical protein